MKTENNSDWCDMDCEDIYLNLICCELILGNYLAALRMMKEEFLGMIQDDKKRKYFEKISAILSGDLHDSSTELNLFWKKEKPINNKLKIVPITLKNKSPKTAVNTI